VRRKPKTVVGMTQWGLAIRAFWSSRVELGGKLPGGRVTESQLGCGIMHHRFHGFWKLSSHCTGSIIGDVFFCGGQTDAMHIGVRVMGAGRHRIVSLLQADA
jgi:hypothetical protein